MRLFLCAFVAMFALTACGSEYDESPDAAPMEQAEYVEDVAEEDMNALLSGTLANSEQVYERGVYEVGYSNSANARIHFATPTAEGRAVMTILSLEQGGFDHPDLQVGSYFSVERYETTENGLRPVIIGCEGARVGSWSYDNPASRISVEVTQPAPDTRRISYIAFWDAPGDSALPDVLSGYFDFQE